MVDIAARGWLGVHSGLHSEFPDYDCRWAGHIAQERAFGTWSDLHTRLDREAWGVASPLSLQTVALATLAAEEEGKFVGGVTTPVGACPLGRIAACLALHAAGQRNCSAIWKMTVSTLSFLSTSWPLFRLLAIIQRGHWTTLSPEIDCHQLFHPSLDWDKYFDVVETYAASPFQEKEMESMMSDFQRDASDEANGVVWKFSSAVTYNGHSISAWTSHCPVGVATAFVLRMQGLILGELDVFKMVESLMQQVDELAFRSYSLEALLGSRWPLFDLLHKVSWTKRRIDDLAFAPKDLQLNLNTSPQTAVDLGALSPAARAITQHLVVASPGPVVVTFVHSRLVGYLNGFLRHADRTGFAGRSLILPQSEAVRYVCAALSVDCLPVISVYPELAKYAFLALAARVGVSAIFTEMNVIWVQNPIPEFVARHRRVFPASGDVHVAQEFYSNQTRPGILFVRPTEPAIVAMASLAVWLLFFPFSVEATAIRYLLEPHRPAYVPSVSFLRADQRHLPFSGFVAVEVLCSENQHVTSDGWFGEHQEIVSFQLQPALYHEVRERTLEAFYGDSQNDPNVALMELLQVRKRMSPKRPTAIAQEIGDLCRPGASNDLSVAEHIVPPWVYILHLNFADGCCEREQAKSSSTALHFGANESRALNGSALDQDFRDRNAKLLSWNRTERHTTGKTPSGKVGYYVWKPYVILQTLLDPNVLEGDIVLWTDAGVHFIAPMRPLIERYLMQSDVSATETPMMEADVTKRDAFILLDADFFSIHQTNQIATGIILVRKTSLSIRFIQHWLNACEDPRIITEEPSSLGQPDYFTFRHHNDDQSAFSLLFKKYGFKPFSQAERDEVVLAARNIAKFLAVSDAFALGQETSQDAYIAAADRAASE